MPPRWTEQQSIFHHFIVAVCEIAGIINDPDLINKVFEQAHHELMNYQVLVDVIKMLPVQGKRSRPKVEGTILDACRVSTAAVEESMKQLNNPAADYNRALFFPKALYGYLRKMEIPIFSEDDALLQR